MKNKVVVIGVSVLLVASLIGNGVQYSLYTKQMNEVNANISSVQTQLDEALAAQTDLQVQLDEALKKQTDLQTQLDTAKQELADKQSEYDLIQQENEALQKSLTDKPQTTAQQANSNTTKTNVKNNSGSSNSVGGNGSVWVPPPGFVEPGVVTDGSEQISYEDTINGGVGTIPD